jgi:flavin reductase (DIM6/NTAB) family NADH-FMN oxidoreductase RutF
MEKQKLGPQPLLYPLPVVLVGANVEGRPNFQVVSWCGIASFSPATVTIGLSPERHTLKGLLEHKTFSVNVASTDMLSDVDYCGIHSGKDVDKSALFEVFYGILDTAPLIDRCPINLECKVVDSRSVGSHVLILGEIVETYVGNDCMSDGRPDMDKIKPILFSIGSMAYHCVGPEIGVAYKVAAGR